MKDAYYQTYDRYLPEIRSSYIRMKQEENEKKAMSLIGYFMKNQ